jgi:hypothetical protein
MEEKEKRDFAREDIFSRVVRAGKRTYFFDVKATRAGEHYITVTESKRRFNNEQGKFFYEKHKLFLYKEDFEKFSNGLTDVIQFIETGEVPEDSTIEEAATEVKHVDVDFDDLGSETEDKANEEKEEEN